MSETPDKKDAKLTEEHFECIKIDMMHILKHVSLDKKQAKLRAEIIDFFSTIQPDEIKITDAQIEGMAVDYLEGKRKAFAPEKIPDELGRLDAYQTGAKSIRSIIFPGSKELVSKTPLSKITNSDIMKMLEIHGGSIHDNHYGILTEFSSFERIKKWILSVKVFRADAYQYLESKGYGLPVYFSRKLSEPTKQDHRFYHMQLYKETEIAKDVLGYGMKVKCSMDSEYKDHWLGTYIAKHPTTNMHIVLLRARPKLRIKEELETFAYCKLA